MHLQIFNQKSQNAIVEITHVMGRWENRYSICQLDATDQNKYRTMLNKHYS